MAVGPAEAERTHSRQQRPVRLRPRPQLPLHAQVERVQRNQRMGALVVEAGRQLPVPQTQGDLQQPDDPGGAFEVPHVGLRRADRQRPPGLP